MRRPLLFTGHALVVLEERKLERAWVERAVYAPDWEQADPHAPGVVRRFAAIAERDGRILRVAVVETDTETRILTAFLDRRARKPQ